MGDGTPTGSRDLVPFGEALRTWFTISLQTFGGPAGQIAVLQRVLVEEKRWIGQQRFLHALSYCTLLPGPEAQQLAVYVGWLLGGVRGGLVAGTLFVLPGVVALLALSVLYVAAGETLAVTALFAGLGPAVVAIVAQAVVRVARRALVHRGLVAVGVAAFVALAVFAVPFPAVVAAGAAAGYALRRHPAREPASRAGDDEQGPPPVVADEALAGGRSTAARGGVRTAALLVGGVALWLAPLAAVVVLTGADSAPSRQGVFFSGAALVTFGGAYAVLAYVAQQAVEVHGWLTPGEMAHGLALAETTPGPLIMVVQFVAFVGAYRDPGALDPWAAATLGALLTTWVTFVPSFLFIFLGAPFVERLRGHRGLSAALSGITAAVVGVLAHLLVYLAVHSLFTGTVEVDRGVLQMSLPDLATVRPGALALTVVAAVLLLRRRESVPRVLVVCVALGAGWTLLPNL